VRNICKILNSGQQCSDLFLEFSNQDSASDTKYPQQCRIQPALNNVTQQPSNLSDPVTPVIWHVTPRGSIVTPSWLGAIDMPVYNNTHEPELLTASGSPSDLLWLRVTTDTYQRSSHHSCFYNTTHMDGVMRTESLNKTAKILDEGSISLRCWLKLPLEK